MKCTCKRKCFSKDPVSGRNKIFSVGEVVDFEKCPPHFVVLDSASINFATASEEELLSAKWSLAEAKEAMQEAFNFKITAKNKEAIVAQILDARDRYIGEEALPPKAE